MYIDTGNREVTAQKKRKTVMEEWGKDGREKEKKYTHNKTDVIKKRG